MIDHPEQAVEAPAPNYEHRVAEWRHARAEQREANAQWKTFEAAYGPNSPGFEDRRQAHEDEALSADAELIELPAPDIAGLADKIALAWEYNEVQPWMRDAILADARRLADEIARPWR